MSPRVFSSRILNLRCAFVITLALLASSAIAQCNLNGNWTGSYSGTKTKGGVTNPDAGTLSTTIFNATATAYNATITTVRSSDGKISSQSLNGTVNGLSSTMMGGDSAGNVTLSMTIASNCNSMSGTYQGTDTGDPNNPSTSSGSVTMSRSGAALSLGQVTFQSAVVGKSTSSQSLSLSNSGTAGLALGPPTTTGDFSATSTCGGNVPPNSSCSISVTCSPTGPGVRTGTLYINDSNKSPIGSAPLTCSGVNPVAGASFVPESGWWWDSKLNGTGFFIEYGGNSGQGLFIGGFLYDASGNDTWLVSTGPLTSAKYSGTWLKATGGQTLTGAYKAPGLATVANIGLTFTDATDAVLTRPDGSQINLTRFSFSATQTRTPPVGGAPQSGWWWAGQTFSGTGYGIEIQGSAVFVVAYVYDATGNPVWYLATGALTSPNSYSGTWSLYSGGPQLTSPEGNYQGTPVNGSAVAMTLNFTDGADGTLTMGNVSIPIVRFQTY